MGTPFYGYRWYDPLTGRWQSRDPNGERAGTNLYGFVRNDCVGRIDYLGLYQKPLGDDSKMDKKAILRGLREGYEDAVGPEWQPSEDEDDLAPDKVAPPNVPNIPKMPGILLPPDTVWGGIAVLRVTYEVDLKCMGCCAAGLPSSLLLEGCRDKLRRFLKFGMSFNQDVVGFSEAEGAGVNGNLAELQALDEAHKDAKRQAPPCYIPGPFQMLLNDSWVIRIPLVG